MNSNEKRILAHVIKLAAQHGYTMHSIYDGEEHQTVPDNVGANPLGIGLGPAFARKDPISNLQRVTEWAYDELNALDEGHLYFTVPDNAPANSPGGLNPNYRPKSRLWVYFIWGNGNNGCDCITDSVAFNHFEANIMLPAQDLAERLSEGKITFADVLVGEVFLDSEGVPHVKHDDDGYAKVFGMPVVGRFMRDTDPVGVAPV